MKAAYPHDELARLPQGFRLRAAHALAVPGLDAERHLLLIARE
jgi:16S rRNA (guanine527-N7)-methyltransferase